MTRQYREGDYQFDRSYCLDVETTFPCRFLRLAKAYKLDRSGKSGLAVIEYYRIIWWSKDYDDIY